MENTEIKEAENDSLNIEELVKDGRNKYPVVCVRCPSRILNSNAADYKEIEVCFKTLNHLNSHIETNLYTFHI